MSELEEYRREKDAFFKEDPHSPLNADQKESFDGLAYYEEDPSLVIEGDLDTDVDLDEVHMTTSTGDDQVYTRAGKLRFEVEGNPTEVTLYASQNDPELFLPFRDATSGRRPTAPAATWRCET